MKILCTICARGGSKGIPNKNIKLLDGIPLIAHTIKCAMEWGGYDDLIISTDDEKIANIAEKYGADVPFMRPKKYSDDNVLRTVAVKHAYKYMKDKNNNYDYVIDLSVTTPFRKPEDIDKALKKLISDNKANNIYTVCTTDKNPYFNLVEINEEGYSEVSKKNWENVTSRQKAPEVYEMNDAINIYKANYIKDNSSNQSDRTLLSVMPKLRSIDIDTPLDFKFAKFIMKELK